LKVSELSPAQLEYQLKHNGLYLQTGSLLTHVRTDIPAVAAGISLLYADYPLREHAGFADFHVRLAAPRNLRRWFKPQVLFLSDGVPPFKPLPLDQALPMLEWGLNWCVSSHANDCLIIHAAVVERNGYAAILPAPPGSGKSTLCAALVNRGWRLLSDELAMIRVSDGQIIPLPRPVSLKNQSIDIIRRYAPEAVFSRAVSDTMKGTVAHMKAPANSVDRATETARAAWVIFPKYIADSTTNMTDLSRPRAFMRVADNAFNYSLLGVQGFASLARLIDNCRCYDFAYSDLNGAVATFDALQPAPECCPP